MVVSKELGGLNQTSKDSKMNCNCVVGPNMDKYIIVNNQRVLVGLFTGCPDCENPIAIELQTPLSENYVYNKNKPACELDSTSEGNYILPLLYLEDFRNNLKLLFEGAADDFRMDSKVTMDKWIDLIPNDELLKLIKDSISKNIATT